MNSKIASAIKSFVPMSLVCWREGYSRQIITGDIFAGITVGLIALPLAMAFAIGSGVPPERGVYTAIVAGFLISLLSGSRVQIGGPTGAFVVIVFDIVQRHGYEGLVIATFLAGIMMVLMGLARFGVFLKFIPYPVTVGFTTGIALTIFSSQIKDFFGLAIDHIPTDFVDKWIAYSQTIATTNRSTLGIGLASLALIFGMRTLNPKIPGAIIVLILATLATQFFDLPIDTIESKFGSIPNRMRKVAAIDATGVHALHQFIDKCRRNNVQLILSGVKEALRHVFRKTGIEAHLGKRYIFSQLDDALAYAKQQLGDISP